MAYNWLSDMNDVIDIRYQGDYVYFRSLPTFSLRTRFRKLQLPTKESLLVPRYAFCCP